MSNILERIINQKNIDLLAIKKKFTNSNLNELIKENKTYINFKNKISDKIKKNKISVIAEIKKASPSAGIIIDQYDPVSIAKNYFQNGATCLSILTEEKFFFGNLQHLADVKTKIKIPILCKDFFIDTYQVPLAKSFEADCILIILSAVDQILAKDLYQAANDLNLSTLIEVHSEKEAEVALSFEDSLIGINNRNLKTLEISLEVSTKLSKILNSHKNPLICESGIHTADDLKFIIKNAKIHNFLIGESLLKSEDIGLKLKQLTQISL